MRDKVPWGDRVLLIEDDPELRELFTETLQQAGYTVTPCSDLHEAKSFLLSSRFQILISDWQLGRDTADQLLLNRQFENLLPPTILVVTAYSDTTQFPNALASRFHVLEKPFRLEVLPKKLEEIMTGRQGF